MNRRAFVLTAAGATAANAFAVPDPVVLFESRTGTENHGAWGGRLTANATFEDRRVDDLQSLSVLLTFNPLQVGSEIVLVESPGRWQVRLRGTGLLSVVTYYSGTRSQSSEITQILETDSWYQLCFAVDLAAHRLGVVFRQTAAESWTDSSYKLLATTFGPETRRGGLIRIAQDAVASLAIYDRALTYAQLRERVIPPPQFPSVSIESCTFPMERDASVQLPRHSDVAMSSRWWYPRKPNDTHDTLRDLAAFHATRLEWIYDAAPDHIRAVKDAGLAFCTTINASDDVKGRPYSGRNFDGGVAFFSWMASWQRDGDPIGACCVNNERYRAHHREVVQGAVRAGAAGVQFDDWASNIALASNNGECFCEFCLRKFAAAKRVDYRDYLKSKGVTGLHAYLDYRTHSTADPLQRAYVDFQADSVRDYLRELKRFLASLTAPGTRRPSLSVNANFNSFSPRNRSLAAADIPDYFVGEGGDESLAGMILNAKAAEAMNRTSIFSPFPYKVDVTRSEIALQYALGQLCLVPYDVWMHSSDVPRYYGRPEDFADLFAFVRQNAPLFDAATIATVGIDVPRDDQPLREVVRLLADRNVPFLLTRPGTRKRPRTVLGKDQAALSPEQLRDASVLDVEPSGVIALPRAGRGFIAIHLVNRNTDELSRTSILRGFGVRLLQPRFWGAIRKLELLAPGVPPRTLTAEPFGRGLRIHVPELNNWAVLRIS